MAGTADGTRFDDLADAHAAASVSSDLTADLLWAGTPVRVEITGRSLARLFHRAVAHVVVDQREPVPRAEISVCLSEPDDTAPVRVLRQIRDTLPRIWAAPDLEVRSSDCGRMLSFTFGRRSHFVMDRQNRMLVGVQHAEHLLLFERTKPLLLPLRVLLQDRGIHVVHAGLVANEGRGALIAGPERVGKSSTALRCFMAGFDFLGDDQAALDCSDAGVLGHSLYAAVQVEPVWLAQLGRFPSAVLDRDPTEDKVGLFLPEVAPQRLKRSVPIRAVILPRLSPHRATRLVPATKAETLMRIAPSTLFQPLGAGAAGLGALRRVVECVPSYWLDTGDDGSAIPETVRHALQ